MIYIDVCVCVFISHHVFLLTGILWKAQEREIRNDKISFSRFLSTTEIADIKLAAQILDLAYIRT